MAESRRPTGLIKNDVIKPQEQQVVSTKATTVSSQTTSKEKSRKNKNQEANVKISRQSKEELDLLIKMTGNKFAYELIDQLIDYYVDNALTNDQRRSFKTMTSNIPK